MSEFETHPVRFSGTCTWCSRGLSLTLQASRSYPSKALRARFDLTVRPRISRWRCWTNSGVRRGHLRRTLVLGRVRLWAGCPVQVLVRGTSSPRRLEPQMTFEPRRGPRAAGALLWQSCPLARGPLAGRTSPRRASHVSALPEGEPVDYRPSDAVQQDKTFSSRWLPISKETQLHRPAAAELWQKLGARAARRVTFGLLALVAGNALPIWSSWRRAAVLDRPYLASCSDYVASPVGSCDQDGADDPRGARGCRALPRQSSASLLRVHVL